MYLVIYHTMVMLLKEVMSRDKDCSTQLMYLGIHILVQSYVARPLLY